MRGQNLQRDRLPKEVRVRLLGNKPLAQGEVGVYLRVRLPETVAAQVLALTAEERGKLILAGLGACPEPVEGVENAKANQ